LNSELRTLSLRRVSITGPESTGKSVLAQRLAGHFNTLWVAEYAREYLNGLGRPYDFEDIAIIARKQFELENAMAKKAKKFLFCDTDFLVTKIWSYYKYGKCDPWIEEMAEYHRYDLYLLCNTDLPWEEDPLREHPQQRDELFRMYMLELKKIEASFVLVSGTGSQRTDRAISAVEMAFFGLRSKV
jgi:NadR type nicotinamide-nucleotide adenylyltransferase